MEIPDKIYFKIGEVSKLADVPTHVLRYWESEFPAITPKRTNSGQRLYRKADVLLLLQIKELLYLKGYTIAGARKYIEQDSDTTEQLPVTDFLENQQANVQPPVQNKKQKNIPDKLLELKKDLLALQSLLTK
ncbi:MAG: MerR family transcriptional regulator [Desulfotalea sp.]